MNSAKEAVSFDEIIQADRKRRQNEALANEIFGRSRSSNDSSRNNSRKSSQTPSLASRVGVAKRSSSSTNIKTQKTNSLQPPSRPSSAASQMARNNRIAAAVNNTKNVSVVAGSGLSIKGTAGPFVVEASNFAPGTTAADIESALQSVVVDNSGLNGLTSCRIMSAHPMVVAEMVFSEKHIADTVISTFNNQKADGRILRVVLKRSGPGAIRSDPAPILGVPSSDLFDNAAVISENEDVDMAVDQPDTYESTHEREPRRAEPDIQDGRYGFGNGSASKGEHTISTTTATTASNTEPAPSQQTPTQSRDDRGESAGRRGDNQDRGRDRPREDERDRNRDRGYDGGRYDRRDDRGGYHRGDRSDNYEGRGGGGGRFSHYGNGVGAPGGGGGGGGGGRGYPTGPTGGRMYSDDMMRGGRGSGGPRGGGGYRGYR